MVVAVLILSHLSIAQTPVSSSIKKNPTEQICELQNAGSFQVSDSLIKLLTVPTMRDTLLLRQYLLSANTTQFNSLFDKLVAEPRWRTGTPFLLMWKIRSLMFSGSLAPLADLADSMAVGPAWPNAEELLQIKLAVKTCQPKEMTELCGIEAKLYRCDYASAVTQYCAIDKSIRSPFLLDAVGRCLTKANRFELQLKAASACSDTSSPEYRYYLGTALVAGGNVDEGRKCLVAILSKNPASVFAQRARIYLTRLNKTDEPRGN